MGEELEEKFGTKVVKDDVVLAELQKFFKAGNGEAYVPCSDIGVDPTQVGNRSNINFARYLDWFFTNQPESV